MVLEILLIYNPRHKSWKTGAIFPSPMLIWVFSHFSAPKYARLNIGEGEGHIWVRTKVWRVNVRNLEKIQDKWLLSQRFVTSIVGLLTIRTVLTDLLPWFGLYGKCFFIQLYVNRASVSWTCAFITNCSKSVSRVKLKLWEGSISSPH